MKTVNEIRRSKTTRSEAASQSWFDVREVGHVLSVRESIVKVDGMPNCMNGQMVEFSSGGAGMVMGFTPESVLVLVFGNRSKVRSGDEVYSRRDPFTISVGDALLGRAVTSLGAPADGLGEIACTQSNPIFQDPPAVMMREPVAEALETGVRIIDSSFPIAKGQRQLIIGDQMTGKTAIVTDTIINQRDKDVICVYCAIGQSQSLFLKTLALLREKKALDYTIVVAGIASAPLGEQYLAPYSAAAIAEYFASQGRDVFVAFDDLGKHAWAYRQLSLLLERSPGREAYPGDIFYIHSQLLERAGKFVPELGGGTITFFPIVPTIQGDITGYIQTNVISITDGQLYLSTPLFQSGFKPSIDFGLSVSRIGNRAQSAAMREVTGKLRLEYLQYLELLRMTTMKADLSEDARKRIQRGQVITELMTQTRSQPSSLAEQVLFLHAIKNGLLDEHTEKLKTFKNKIYGWMKLNHPDVIDTIQRKKQLDEMMKLRMDKAVKEYLEQDSDDTSG